MKKKSHNKNCHLILLKTESKSFFMSNNILVWFFSCWFRCRNRVADKSLNLPNFALVFSNFVSLSSNQSANQSVTCSINQSINQSNSHSVSQPVGKSVSKAVGRLVSGSVSQPVGRSGSWLVSQLVNRPIGHWASWSAAGIFCRLQVETTCLFESKSNKPQYRG